jgi:UDP-2-acetamido-3-amino-2,3-dideoxy-glucuronate N-acetyltransferase
MFVHPTATVAPDVILGEQVKIWHHVHVMSGASLGAFVMLGQSVFIGAGVKIGARCRVQNFANLPEGVELGDDVFVGPGVSFTNVKYPRAHHSAQGKYLATPVGRGASIGANATILPGIELGDYCMVGAGAVVTRAVPAHALVFGNPARQRGWVGYVGERLRSDGETLVCPRSGARYRLSHGVLLAVEAP